MSQRLNCNSNSKDTRDDCDYPERCVLLHKQLIIIEKKKKKKGLLLGEDLTIA